MNGSLIDPVPVLGTDTADYMAAENATKKVEMARSHSKERG